MEIFEHQTSLPSIYIDVYVGKFASVTSSQYWTAPILKGCLASIANHRRTSADLKLLTIERPRGEQRQTSLTTGLSTRHPSSASDSLRSLFSSLLLSNETHISLILRSARINFLQVKYGRRVCHAESGAMKSYVCTTNPVRPACFRVVFLAPCVIGC